MRRELTVFRFPNIQEYNDTRDHFSKEFGSGFMSEYGWTFDNMNNAIIIFTDITDPRYATMYCQNHGGIQIS